MGCSQFEGAEEWQALRESAEAMGWKSERSREEKFRTQDGSFHAFLETEAKDAAMDCGSKQPRKNNPREHWKALWD